VTPTLLLHPPGGSTLRLRPGGQIRIGRQDDNDIILDSSHTSRDHAVLVWAEGADHASLLDLGSANGVTIDGVRVRGSQTLGSKGTIQIGALKVTFELEEISSDLAASYNLPDDSESFVLDTGEQFRGTFELAADFGEILLGLENEKRSGTLRVTTEKTEGLVQFAQGRVMSAAWGSSSGLAALEKIVRTKRGSYLMESRLEPSDEFLNLMVSEFLSRGF
jgi:pSer/pThr/pTyr-binding forkhead associated (FHA) protein